MADWIDDLVQRAKEKYTGQRQEDEKFNREHRLKETLSKDFWNKLLATLEAATTEFNQKFGGSVIAMSNPGTNTATITAQFTDSTKGKITVACGFQPEKHRIFVNYGKPGESVEYCMELLDDSRVVAKLETETFTLDDLARKIIVSLTGV